MRLRVKWAVAVGLVLLNTACNSILGNDPHDLELVDLPDSTSEGGQSSADGQAGEAGVVGERDATQEGPRDAAVSDAAQVGSPPDASDARSCSSPELVCGTGCVPSDVHNCGACGNDCTNLAHVSGAASCTAGACAFTASACAPGWMDCNGDPADGCETDISQAAPCGGVK